MSVTRVSEVPRVTKPYTEEEWNEIVELGRAVDRDLEKADVRLTMGGEPTFVSADDFDAAEWNTAAMGPNKRKLSIDLFRRLKEKYAPNGLVHFGQGKWYPGEPLPRWSLSLFFMHDGSPLFTGAIADEAKPSGADHAIAKKLLEGVARHLGVDASCVFPACEDALYYVWREGKLPVGVDPAHSKLDDPLERARLARLFAAGLDAVVGHALPIAQLPSTRAWRTRAWRFRDRCFLVPGDSPMGLRLPLDAKPWLRDSDEKDKDHEYAPLASRAMCAEPRGGVLYVFMPPAETFDEYVALVRAVEKSASELSVPVMFEGYAPPRDPRVSSLSVTPDPGVIEVNIHPSSSWDELVERTTHLYEAARQTRLAAEKFMIDGRHVGTGGGNHVVLGAAKPDDSPFLRRPDLLRSLVAYFHQHPSLSTLFSGMFIGPTSQAPRIDEARNDSVFELEIAFREVTRAMEKHDGAPPPWTCDRLFRDILVDVTGNTHRAEFCIDKLYSPDSSTGRLGLLEMRGFEMPPHARMSLMQQLLLRALVSRFWKKPYAPERLARWGTELHDRFMLPFFVWNDFEIVLAELRDAGIPLRAEWFAPHFEFRFPRLGEVETRGIRIELRAALEPWHVMGEDVTAGGTARFVDSSLERVEVKVSGLPRDRYELLCNGAPLPLRACDRSGGESRELVCGVRYRAWQPPRCLHPHIPVHAPLTFDLFDTFANRSVGGCRYHVAHPGGRSHDTRPVNALEAEGRRRARFFTTHTAEPASASGKRAAEARRVHLPPSLDFPFTLDLRRLDPPR
jgi:uncharacterized protein (DUF2126 family)